MEGENQAQLLTLPLPLHPHHSPLTSHHSPLITHHSPLNLHPHPRPLSLTTNPNPNPNPSSEPGENQTQLRRLDAATAQRYQANDAVELHPDAPYWVKPEELMGEKFFLKDCQAGKQVELRLNAQVTPKPKPHTKHKPHAKPKPKPNPKPNPNPNLHPHPQGHAAAQ